MAPPKLRGGSNLTLEASAFIGASGTTILWAKWGETLLAGIIHAISLKWIDGMTSLQEANARVLGAVAGFFEELMNELFGGGAGALQAAHIADAGLFTYGLAVAEVMAASAIVTVVIYRWAK